MQLKTEDNSFIRFLKDEKFIEWKLLPNDELNIYWMEFLQLHPEEKDNILLAESYLKKVDFDSIKISPKKKRETMHRLKQSLNKYNQKRKIRSFTYVAVSCAAILLLTIFIHKELIHPDCELVPSRDFIVGNELESEDILFITENNTASFKSNVDIQIDNDKTAQIYSKNNEIEEISINQHTMNKLVVPYGKRSKILLADGTQVWLNSGSTLEFPSDFTGKSRDVYLSGEMYLEVAPDKNKSFNVHTMDYNIKVYGTKFNVSSYNGFRSSVVLVEGCVGLQSTNKQELRLLPNEQAIYLDKGVFTTKEVDVIPFICWKDGYLTFEDTPVIDALKLIERYYNFSFNYDDDVSLKDLTCTGKIVLSDNLDNVMTTLALISNTKYKKKDKLIYIYKE